MTPENEYYQEIESGMFWEWHPEMTGNWNSDAEMWLKKKGYSDVVVNLTAPQIITLEKFKVYRNAKLIEKMTNHIQPNYYKRTIKGVEVDVYDIANAFGLPACLFNALKYILRAGNKENESTEKDLNKAAESIRRQLEYAKQ